MGSPKSESKKQLLKALQELRYQAEARKAETAQPDPLSNVKTETAAPEPLDKVLKNLDSSAPTLESSSDKFSDEECRQWEEIVAMSRVDLLCAVSDAGDDFLDSLLPKVRGRLTARLGGFHNSTPDDWMI